MSQGASGHGLRCLAPGLPAARPGERPADLAPRGRPAPPPLAEARQADGRQPGRRAHLHGVSAAAQNKAAFNENAGAPEQGDGAPRRRDRHLSLRGLHHPPDRRPSPPRGASAAASQKVSDHHTSCPRLQSDASEMPPCGRLPQSLPLLRLARLERDPLIRELRRLHRRPPYFRPDPELDFSSSGRSRKREASQVRPSTRWSLGWFALAARRLKAAGVGGGNWFRRRSRRCWPGW